MGVTADNLVELTSTDNTNDEVVVYDDSASRLKKISPDNLRDSLLTGSALVTVDDTTLTADRAVISNGSGQLAAATTTTNELQGLAGATANRALATDGSGIVTTSSTTDTELGALNGLTVSRALTSDGSGLVAVSATTSGELAALNGLTASRAMVSDGSGLTSVSATTSGEIAALNGLTASRAMVTDGSGLTTTSATTATELGYVNGVTSAIQTQLDRKPAQNIVYNGNFDLWDLGTSFSSAADDTYNVPGWWFLSDGNTFDIDQTTASGNGSEYFLRITSGTAGTTRAGIFHIVEESDVYSFINSQVPLSMYASVNTSTGLDVSIGIFKWAGSSDAATSDFVSTWAMPPTVLATSWTAQNTTTSSASGLRTIALENETVAGGTYNLGVFIGCEFTGTSQTCDIGRVQLAHGITVDQFYPTPIAIEKTRAQRRYYRVTGDGSLNGPQIRGYAKTSGDIIMHWDSFPTSMRATPSTAVNGTWAVSNCTGPLINAPTEYGYNLYITSSTNDVYCTMWANSTDDNIEFVAEPTAAQPF